MSSEFDSQLKAILCGKRIQNCSREVKEKYWDFYINNNPNPAMKERLIKALEKRKKIRERHIREGTLGK